MRFSFNAPIARSFEASFAFPSWSDFLVVLLSFIFFFYSLLFFCSFLFHFLLHFFLLLWLSLLFLCFFCSFLLYCLCILFISSFSFFLIVLFFHLFRPPYYPHHLLLLPSFLHMKQMWSQRVMFVRCLYYIVKSLLFFAIILFFSCKTFPLLFFAWSTEWKAILCRVKGKGGKAPMCQFLKEKCVAFHRVLKYKLLFFIFFFGINGSL